MGLVGNLQEEAAALVEVLGERLYQATVAASTNVQKSKEACSFVVLTRSLFSKSKKMDLYSTMKCWGFKPNALKACAALAALSRGWIAWIGPTAVYWTKPLRLVEMSQVGDGERLSRLCENFHRRLHARR
ncbi:uncharacterized protein LOC112349237 [Selaginella moellendorffii]|uniref:uncharacterized protein LOC112349237 n=1 Tax=Selaginella moellendorffii TaxID=88036 RepID=UPI000D1CA0EC|nr:uncharacterized protein LOC112349237 [Selaginella moellendorffii]|eukprot:XP_024539054.1 uncharacterized protein LOC112349237 [Selaginella moellendorffii]